MPIITVEVVVGTDPAPEEELAQALADAIGGALGSPTGQTWVRLRRIARGDYAENGHRIEVGELPVFVTVLRRRPPRGGELEAEIGVLVRTIAQVLRRPPAAVHVEYAPDATGRVAFGGRLVE